jgi:hypothetical protein
MMILLGQITELNILPMLIHTRLWMKQKRIVFNADLESRWILESYTNLDTFFIE